MIRHSAIAVGYGVLGAALVLLGLYIYLLESRSDLRVWHLAELDAEYRADDAADIGSFADYQRLEQRLFNQLQEQVYARVQPSADRILDRYNPFFSYLQRRMIEFLGLAREPVNPTRTPAG